MMHPVLSADMKQQNRRLVYHYIQGKPGQTVTRTEIGRQTGISAPTVLKIFDFFEKRGILESIGAADSQEPGRKSSIFRFVPQAAHAVGASYDGQMLELSLVDLNFETVRNRRIPISTDVSTLVGTELAKHLTAFIADVPTVIGVGISLPASVDNGIRRIRYQAPPALGGRFSGEDLSASCQALEQALGLPVLLENDVNCAAMAEFRALGGGEHDDLIYIMLGGGIGAGLILEGKLRRGGSFSCGEIGYMSWDPDFSVRDGSGYLEWELYQNSRKRFGTELLSGAGAPYPEGLIPHFADELALAVANLSNALDVSHFVLGGRVAEDLGPALLEQINRRLLGLCVHDVQLVPSQCRDACARGAASQLLQNELGALLSD